MVIDVHGPLAGRFIKQPQRAVLIGIVSPNTSLRRKDKQMLREKNFLATMPRKIEKLQTQVEESLQKFSGSYFSVQGCTALAGLMEIKESTDSLQLAVAKAVEELQSSMQMSTQEDSEESRAMSA